MLRLCLRVTSLSFVAWGSPGRCSKQQALWCAGSEAAGFSVSVLDCMYQEGESLKSCRGKSQTQNMLRN